jgi:hypothetical protein
MVKVENNQSKLTFSTSGSKNWASVSPYSGAKAESSTKDKNGMKYYPSQIPKTPQYNPWGCNCGKKS